MTDVHTSSPEQGIPFRSAVDALSRWYELRERHHRICEPTPLAPEERLGMQEVRNFLDASSKATSLQGAINALWVAAASGELMHADLMETLALLGEAAALVAEVAYVAEEIDHRLHLADLAEATAGGKPARRRRSERHDDKRKAEA